MTQANDERAARKEYIRRRQKTVFSICLLYTSDAADD